MSAHYNIGDVLIKLGKDAEAEASYREAVRLDPKKTNARYYLSLSLEKRGDVDGAIAEMREFVQLGGIPGWRLERRQSAPRRAPQEERGRRPLSEPAIPRPAT